MPGTFFLSGEARNDEDNEEEATLKLNAMYKLVAGKLPWALSCSYGKALQTTCVVTWMGKKENEAAAQKAPKAVRMRMVNANGDATSGNV